MKLKALYKKEKGKFKRIHTHEFPTNPMDGIWLVMHKEQSHGYTCITRLSDLPKLNDITNKLALSKYRDDIANIMREANASAMEIADNIIDFICKKIEEDNNDKC